MGLKATAAVGGPAPVPGRGGLANQLPRLRFPDPHRTNAHAGPDMAALHRAPYRAEGRHEGARPSNRRSCLPELASQTKTPSEREAEASVPPSVLSAAYAADAARDHQGFRKPSASQTRIVPSYPCEDNRFPSRLSVIAKTPWKDCGRWRAASSRSGCPRPSAPLAGDGKLLLIRAEGQAPDSLYVVKHELHLVRSACIPDPDGRVQNSFWPGGRFCADQVPLGLMAISTKPVSPVHAGTANEPVHL